MKPPLLLCLALGVFAYSPCFAQTANDPAPGQTVATMVDPFSGRIQFHAEGAGVF